MEIFIYLTWERRNLLGKGEKMQFLSRFFPKKGKKGFFISFLSDKISYWEKHALGCHFKVK